MTEKIMYICQQ